MRMLLRRQAARELTLTRANTDSHMLTGTLWTEAKYMLQVFETNQRAGGVLITDGKVLQILPSLAEFEYDPAYDGKVCVSIWRFDGFEEGTYVDENGNPWELA